MRLRSPHDGDIARLAIPALGSLVAEPLYILADTAIVGRIGTTELAGLALASTVLLSVHAIMIFLAYGTTGPVARLIGAGRHREAAERSMQGLWLAAILGVGSALVLAIIGRSLLQLLGADGDVLDAGWRYLWISLPGFPFLLIALAGNGSFHGRQNTTTPLVLAVTGAVLNLVIELVLIPGLGYGIGASALSTVIAQTIVGIAVLVVVIRWVRSNGASIGPHPPLMFALLRTGRALILRTVSLRGSFTLSTAIAARIGVPDVAAHQIALGVWGTLALALDAVAIAGQALTGKWLGTGDTVTARDATRRMIEIDVAVGALMGTLVLVFRQPLAQLFTEDPAVIAIATLVLVHVAIQQPLNGIVFALDGILIGAGDLDYLAKWMVIAAVAFAAAAVTVFVTGAGLGWLWMAIALLMVVRAVSLIARWRQDTWLVAGAD